MFGKHPSLFPLPGVSCHCCHRRQPNAATNSSGDFLAFRPGERGDHACYAVPCHSIPSTGSSPTAFGTVRSCLLGEGSQGQGPKPTAFAALRRLAVERIPYRDQSRLRFGLIRSRLTVRENPRRDQSRLCLDYMLSPFGRENPELQDQETVMTKVVSLPLKLELGAPSSRRNFVSDTTKERERYF